MHEQRNLLVFALVVGAVLGSAALVSYFGDPEGVFNRDAHEGEISDRLLSGWNVGNFDNYNERLIQRHLIRNDTRQVEVIVLGSSRSMQIRASSLPDPLPRDRVFLNHAMPGASLEDDIAILDLYLDRGALPATVVIGADPWILNAGNGRDEWRVLQQEYTDGVARFNATRDASGPGPEDIIDYYDRLSSLIARPILFKSIDKLVSGSYFTTGADEGDMYLKLTDGSIVYPSSITKRTVEEVDTVAQEYADASPIYSLGDFTLLDEGSRSRFEATVDWLKSRNTTVILFLPPYHPIVYDTITADARYARVAEAESYFREFATRENIAVVGSYDPAPMNLTSADFYDGHHLKREVVDRVFLAALPGT